MKITAHVAVDLLPHQVEKWNLLAHVADDLLPYQIGKWNLLLM